MNCDELLHAWLLGVLYVQGQYSKGVPWSWDDVTPSLDVNYLRWENATYDGEGEFIFPGPPSSRYGGFLSSLQLEGMRDGLEDLSMYQLLQSRLEAARAAQVDISDEEVAAVVVPAALLAGVSPEEVPTERLWSEDPQSLRLQWRVVAAAIESLTAKLKSGL